MTDKHTPSLNFILKLNARRIPDGTATLMRSAFQGESVWYDCRPVGDVSIDRRTNGDIVALQLNLDGNKLPLAHSPTLQSEVKRLRGALEEIVVAKSGYKLGEHDWEELSYKIRRIARAALEEEK